MARKRDEVGMKAKILLKAKEYFTQYGYSKTNIEDIIKETHMSRRTLYSYFKGGKKEILETLLEQEWQELAAEINEVVENPKLNFMEKIKQLMPLLINRFVQKVNLIKDLQQQETLMFVEMMCFKKKMFSEKIVALFRQGQQEGKVRLKIPLEFVVSYIIESAQEPFFYNAHQDFNVSLDEAIQSISVVTLKGLLLRENEVE